MVPWWHPPPTRSLRLPGILCEKLLTYLRGSWRPERDRASATRARPSGPPRAWPDRERGSSARSGVSVGWPSYCTEVGRVWQEACRESPERPPSDDCVGTRVCVGWLCVLVRDPPSLPVSQCVLFVPHMYVRCGVVWCVGGVVPWWHPPPTRSLRLPGILCEKLLTYLRGSWRPERDRASATRARPSGPPRAWPDRERGSSARSGVSVGWPSYCTEVGRVWQEACRESPERPPSDDCVGTRVCVGWLCVLVREDHATATRNAR